MMNHSCYSKQNFIKSYFYNQHNQKHLNINLVVPEDMDMPYLSDHLRLFQHIYCSASTELDGSGRELVELMSEVKFNATVVIEEHFGS